jgi:hypothetical protein
MTLGLFSNDERNAAFVTATRNQPRLEDLTHHPTIAGQG